MARPHSFDRVGQFNAPTESTLVAGDAYRKSLGVSRQTFHRYIKQFDFKPSWVNGRLFLDRRQLRSWEDKVHRGVFGRRPVVGQKTEEEAVV